MKGRVLAVDDDRNMTSVIEARLKHRDFDVTTAASGDEAKGQLGQQDFDVVVTDLNMRGVSGIDLCKWTVENRPDVPVIVITAFGSLETAVAAIRAGAYDFITKPLEIETLVIAIDRALQHRSLREEVRRLRSAVERKEATKSLIGESPPMVKLRELLSRVADSSASVLITGESGTGKEVAARLLHTQGPRKAGPFVAINCAAVPENLLESELFGHVRGAFTDAKEARTGLFVQANNGTLFLDEIGDMPLGLQPKVLRALEERHVRPVGGDREQAFDVRIVSASNRDLEDACETGGFRTDLYYRLNVIQVEIPPLRSRSNDILLLAQHFVDELRRTTSRSVQGLSTAAAERLLSYGWPGNVRELKNCIERAMALTQHEQLTVEDLPERVRAYRGSRLVLDSENPAELVSMVEIEKRYIARVMEAVQGNKTKAAKVLGFDRTTLYRKLEQYEIGGRPET